MISSAQGEGNAGTVRTRTKRVGRATVRQLSLSSAPSRSDGGTPTRTDWRFQLGPAAAIRRQIARASSQVPTWSSRLVLALGLANIASATARQPPQVGLAPPLTRTVSQPSVVAQPHRRLPEALKNRPASTVSG